MTIAGFGLSIIFGTRFGWYFHNHSQYIGIFKQLQQLQTHMYATIWQVERPLLIYVTLDRQPRSRFAGSGRHSTLQIATKCYENIFSVGSFLWSNFCTSGTVSILSVSNVRVSSLSNYHCLVSRAERKHRSNVTSVASRLFSVIIVENDTPGIRKHLQPLCY